jgi:hypothetical protein
VGKTNRHHGAPDLSPKDWLRSNLRRTGPVNFHQKFIAEARL